MVTKFNAELEIFHVNNTVTMFEQTQADLNNHFEDIAYVYKELKSVDVIHKSKTRVMISGMDTPLLSIHALIE